MRSWLLQAKFWTYSMMYGQSHLMPPYTLSHTSGSGSAASFWMSLANWLKTKTAPLFQALEMRLPSSSISRYQSLIKRYRHVGSHRGSGRQTRSSVRRLRELRYSPSTAPLSSEIPSSTEISYAPGSRVYRKLAWSQLQHDAVTLRRSYKFEDDKYGEMP